MRIDRARVIDGGAGATLVEVSSEGATGIGLTQSAYDYIAPIIERGPYPIAPTILGEDPREPRRLWSRMYLTFGAAKGRGSEGGLGVNAMAALDMAVWDLAGKISNLPLHAMLGGAIRDSIPAYASSSLFISSSYEQGGTEADWRKKSPDHLLEEAKTYVRQGFRAVKLGWGNNFGPDDEDRLAALREGLGPERQLMVDFGCPAYWTPGWNASAAIRAARILERYGLFFMEEPMPPQDVAGHKAVADAVDINIATGESLTLIDEFVRYIDESALDIVQPDAAQLGITQLSEIGRRAEAVGILCVPHSPWSSLCVAAHSQACLTMRNSAVIEYPAMASFEEGSTSAAATAFYQWELVEHPPELVDGLLRPSQRPGLGLGGFRPDALERIARGEVIGAGTWAGAEVSAAPRAEAGAASR
jgi:L-alanine-DL-glutamate epimerase-like enolase superfamily enzyme